MTCRPSGQPHSIDSIVGDGDGGGWQEGFTGVKEYIIWIPTISMSPSEIGIAGDPFNCCWY